MSSTTRKFEEKICEKLSVNYCVATGSGTSALLMALLAFDVKLGDKVVVQDRSWISPAHAAHLLRAQISLIDVEPDIPVVNIEHLLEIIDRRPKVIILVHMNGRHFEGLDKIVDLCKENGIHLIEDSAQAIGSKYKNSFLGTIGDVGCFSLAVSKTVSSGQGGFLVTNNPDIYDKLLKIRTHGITDVFEPVWTQFGMNFRFTDPQAAIALNQLRKLEDRIAAQNIQRNRYIDGLATYPGIRILPIRKSVGEAGPYFDAWVDNPVKLSKFLSKKGIGSRRFYPSLSTATYLDVHNVDEITNAISWHQHGLILPCGPDLSSENLEETISAIVEFFET